MNLDELTKLKSLSQLELNLSYQSTECYEFIRQAKSLRSVRLDSGFVDDQVASWIVENGGITSFDAGQNCVMTDVGIETLAECNSLKHLSVGGFVTRVAVERLLRLPSLRTKLDHLRPSARCTTKPSDGPRQFGNGAWRRSLCPRQGLQITRRRLRKRTVEASVPEEQTLMLVFKHHFYGTL